MHRSLVALATGVVMITLTPAALADRDAERESLSRLAHEIQALHALVDRAEAHADPDARIRFQYDWLRHDLERVQAGIEEHLRAPRAQPRRVEPLSGDYRR
ncbi:MULTISPECIES: RAQPRD family integrative conjugative element protein [unclassified Thioalkalivibrio]|uniref:integrative conjugative element protein, RAQPRD family n=1 Tax=unclassified Thioalkalivibrio TaxID=2621013 RepID=UPI00036CF16C|nr:MULTISPECIES: RAQPRD family integrative conjugative element protein [unclassified Thioalkalivibrio]